jgi:hypothetical protein
MVGGTTGLTFDAAASGTIAKAFDNCFAPFFDLFHQIL